MLEVTDLATVTKKLYEGMFLVDTALAASDWDGVIGSIEAVLKRVMAKVISIRKWDERRLAYDIDKTSRGTYILVYFECDGEKIQEIEKTVQLSERIMRVLILNAEHMTQEDIEKETPAARAEKVQEEHEAAAEKKAVEQPKPAADSAAVASDSAEAKEDVAPAAQGESSDEPAAATQEKQEVEDEPAQAASSSEEPAAEASEEAENDEPKTAE